MRTGAGAVQLNIPTVVSCKAKLSGILRSTSFRSE
jgi:hypothetical protein